MTTTFQKDPAATLDYSVDWTEFLETGEAISASTWTVPDGITQVTTSFTDTKGIIWLSGGTLGKAMKLLIVLLLIIILHVLTSAPLSF